MGGGGRGVKKKGRVMQKQVWGGGRGEGQKEKGRAV